MVSEATAIPGNAGLGTAEREERRRRIFEPFHSYLSSALDGRDRRGLPTRLVTIHSFTPVFLGERRPWHAGIAFERAMPMPMRCGRRWKRRRGSWSA